MRRDGQMRMWYNYHEFCHNYVEFEMPLRYPSGNVDEVIRYVGIKLKRISRPEKVKD